jgi:methyltransferase
VTVPILAAAIVTLTMAGEAAVAARNERTLRRAGAIEPRGDVYSWMRIAYPAALAALIAEGALRAVHADGWAAGGAIVFAASKGLKYWAVATLGHRWTFRVLVPPRSTRIVRGPYRWLSHPNYVAVAGELTGLAIAMHALLAGVPAVLGFALLMHRRVRVEEHALAESRMRRC